ncbi:MAG: tetratricopeptide repeat protein [Pseudomonadales bacterium]|nr:tetratricopeptide repeat protein [Halioglobus sp.]MCP5130955.1 tetratricopeptide repeat protein [Pseudomonadales bacterium]
MEAYRTEEEQVEALRRWWSENGRSTIIAIIVALGLGFGYQGYKNYSQGKDEGASELYQRMLQTFNSPALTPEQLEIAVQLAQQLKNDFSGTAYAQFASLHLARLAVGKNALADAQAELHWVLGKADKGSDVARIAQLRLARVLAANGEAEQGLGILDEGTEGPYAASYAIARGDILLSLGRTEQASEAYTAALALAADNTEGLDLVAVKQKLQALNPQAPKATVVVRETTAVAPVVDAGSAVEGEEVEVEVSEGDSIGGEG